MIIVWLSSSDLLVSHNNGPPCSPRSCSDRAFQNFPIRPVFFGQCFDMRISFDKRINNIYGTHRQNERSIRQTYRFSPHFNIPSRQTSCSLLRAFVGKEEQTMKRWINITAWSLFFFFTPVTSGSADDLQLPPLFEAAIEGDGQRIQHILNEGGKIDATLENNATALMFAAQAGQTNSVFTLLDHGADINAGDDMGWTPLMIAAQKGRTEVVRMLLDSGADIQAANDGGMTALLLAVLDGHTDIVRMLLNSGADIDAGDENNWTPLMIAAYEGHIEAVRLLLSKGADIDAKDREGMTALIIAAFLQPEDMIELLLDNGADPNQKSCRGFSPLIAAGKTGMRTSSRF